MLRRVWDQIRRVWRYAIQPLERQFKVQLFAALRVLLGSHRTRQAPNWSAQPRSVLLLRHGRIGDMVLVTGMIAAIARTVPGISIDVLAAPGNAAVLEGNPHVRHVLTGNTKKLLSMLAALRRIRRGRYDAVLDPVFPKASLTNMLLLCLSGARRRIAIAGRGNDFALTLPVAQVTGAVHHVDQTAAVLAAFGADLERISREAAATTPPAPLQGVSACRPATGWGIWRSEIYLSPSERHSGEARWRGKPGALRLLVNISASSAERVWPEDCFIAALQQVQARFPRVLPLIVGAPQDAQRMERIALATGAYAAHTPHYRQMMGIAAASDLVLTGDTSVTHVACAFGKPVLALFAGNGGDAFGPYSGGYIISTPGATLASLNVEPVVQGLEALILSLATAVSRREPRPLRA
jgi:ADP-heptose:LPS heptosyltransferase